MPGILHALSAARPGPAAPRPRRLHRSPCPAARPPRARWRPLRALLLWLAALALLPAAHATGFGLIRIPPAAGVPALAGAVWYPCAAPQGAAALGPTTLQGLLACDPPKHRQWPLVILSHGSGGSYLGHRDTAETLARAGFVVAAIEHRGDNAHDMARRGHLDVFASRPGDLSRLIDFMTEHWRYASHLIPYNVGVFGYSRGGYDALVLAGAQPDLSLLTPFCQGAASIPWCGEIARRAWPVLPEPDPRVKAIVLADPLNLFSRPGLARVDVPVQIWASQFGGDGIVPSDVTALQRNLPRDPDYHLAKQASHHAFLPACAAQQRKQLPSLCRDAAGFDRQAFHQRLNASVKAFFQDHL
ncbi:MAG: alpha/beta hydrolase [Bordetella sp.]|nr:alpha/beta hydrolase [Bordetella sp.]